MKRVVKPELLDQLPPDDPGAAGSRRDLCRLNRLMGHARILGRLLVSAAPGRALTRIVELGAGDGTMMLQLARRFARQWPHAEVTFVDKSDVMSGPMRDEFATLGWRAKTVTTDVFDWLKANNEPVDAIIANLFLHHFAEDRLAALLRLAAEQTVLFAAAEPRRSRVALAFSRLAGCIGCNAVTRHDIVASVRAGFAGQELSALWPQERRWRLREAPAGLFSHVFLAGGAGPGT